MTLCIPQGWQADVILDTAWIQNWHILHYSAKSYLPWETNWWIQKEDEWLPEETGGECQVEWAKIPDSDVQDVSASMLLSLENEDDEFLDEFNRFIKDSDLAEAEDDSIKPTKYGVEDS